MLPGTLLGSKWDQRNVKRALKKSDHEPMRLSQMALNRASVTIAKINHTNRWIYSAIQKKQLSVILMLLVPGSDD